MGNDAGDGNERAEQDDVDSVGNRIMSCVQLRGLASQMYVKGLGQFHDGFSIY